MKREPRTQALRWLEKVKARRKVGRRVKAIVRIEPRERRTADGWLERRAIVFNDESEIVADFGDDGYTILDYWGSVIGPCLWWSPGRYARYHEFTSFERADLPPWLDPAQEEIPA